MGEPSFAVPLSAMIHTYEAGDARVWSCKLGGPWIGEDPSCCRDTYAPSQAEARSAAITHLADVHDIYPISPESSKSWAKTEEPYAPDEDINDEPEQPRWGLMHDEF